jgi:flagellar biosynthesis/type III secretory pathway protein FliH
MAAQRDPVIEEAAAIMKAYSESEEFRLRQLHRERWLRDRLHERNEAKREGWEEGRAEGEARGLEEGLRQGRESGVRAALDRGLPLDDVVAIFDLSPEEAARLAPTRGPLGR